MHKDTRQRAVDVKCESPMLAAWPWRGSEVSPPVLRQYLSRVQPVCYLAPRKNQEARGGKLMQYKLKSIDARHLATSDPRRELGAAARRALVALAESLRGAMEEPLLLADGFKPKLIAGLVDAGLATKTAEPGQPDLPAAD